MRSGLLPSRTAFAIAGTRLVLAAPLTADPHPLPLYECREGSYGLRNILSAR
jgi:hypothetical protein